MRKEFIVERQGKSFCLYAGLLDLAHQQGLQSIRTELVQAPTDANNRVAICSATVTLHKDGVDREFTGIGDAAPNNVAPAMQTCLLRMAETRAKARALRDAVNIGVAAFEELGDDDAYDGAPERGYAISGGRSSRSDRSGMPLRTPMNGSARPPQRLQSAPASGASSGVKADDAPAAGGGITPNQLDAIRSLCRKQAVDPDEAAREKFSAESLSALSEAQGREMIRHLNPSSSGRVAMAV